MIFEKLEIFPLRRTIHCYSSNMSVFKDRVTRLPEDFKDLS